MFSFAVTATRSPHRVAHRAHDLPREPRAVLEAVRPMRRSRRFSFGERNALEQVVVAEVDLDRVEPAFDEDAGTVGELLA